MANGQYLFYCGLALMIAAVAAGIVAGMILWVSGRHIRSQLRREYGEKRH